MQNEFLTIQTGKFKNQKIPIPKAIKGNSNFTSAILKKSLFASIESLALNEKIEKEKTLFVDLFSGSGQIGIEFASNGFGKIIFFELDFIRFKELKKTLGNFEFNFELYHKDSFRFHSKFVKENFNSIVYFIDPPYSFWETNFSKIENLISEIEKENHLLNTFLYIQAPKEYSLKNYNERRIGNQKIITTFGN